MKIDFKTNLGTVTLLIELSLYIFVNRTPCMIVIFLQCSFKLCMLTELWTLIYTVQRHSSTRSYISCPGRATTPRSVQNSRQNSSETSYTCGHFYFATFLLINYFRHLVKQEILSRHWTDLNQEVPICTTTWHKYSAEQ